MAIYVVRHAKAGERRVWSGEDIDRPLSKTGRTQSHALATRLSTLKPSTLLSSPYVRCVQTLEPLAELTGLDITIEPRICEYEPFEPVLELLAEVADRAVLCSHGDIIPATIAALETANYGFGFGTLSADLAESLSGSTSIDWATEEKFHITGYVGTDAIDGSYKYYDVNRGVAWDITSGELTTDDAGAIANDKIDFSNSVFMEDNGYYNGSPWFGWGFQ